MVWNKYNSTSGQLSVSINNAVNDIYYEPNRMQWVLIATALIIRGKHEVKTVPSLIILTPSFQGISGGMEQKSMMWIDVAELPLFILIGHSMLIRVHKFRIAT
jgi:hypothetical protein